MQTTITIGEEKYPIAVPNVESSELFDWEGLKVLAWNRRFVATSLMSANSTLSVNDALALTGKLGAFGDGPGSLNDAVSAVMVLAGMKNEAGEDAPAQPTAEAANA